MTSHGLGQRVGQRGFADTGYVFDQQVATRQQARDTQPDLPVLAQDDRVQLVDYRLDDSAGFRDCFLLPHSGCCHGQSIPLGIQVSDQSRRG